MDTPKLNIWIWYGHFNVEIKEEHCLYDFMSALVAIGGYMGLFLGFSCQSIPLGLIDILESRFRTRHK